jgi:hypothetical protein
VFTGFASTVKFIPIVVTKNIEETRQYSYETSIWTRTNVLIIENTVNLGYYDMQYGYIYYRYSKTFRLERGWEITFEIKTSRSVLVTLYAKEGTQPIASESGVYIIPRTGEYYISYANLDPGFGAVLYFKVTVTAKLELVQNTGMITWTTTKYEVIYVTLIEWLTQKRAT